MNDLFKRIIDQAKQETPPQKTEVLTEEERLLLSRFRKLPLSKRQAILDLII